MSEVKQVDQVNQVKGIIEQTFRRGPALVDWELDDDFLLQGFARYFPFVIRCLRPKKDSPVHNANKTALVKELVDPTHMRSEDLLCYHEETDDLKATGVASRSEDLKATGEDLKATASGAEDLALNHEMEVILSRCRELVDVHGKLYITITAPSERFLQAVDQDEKLSSVPKQVVFYSGQYNLENSPSIMKWAQQPQNVIVDFSRFVLFGLNQEPASLKSLTGLLGPVTSEYWQRVRSEKPSVYKKFYEFQSQFNRDLIAPHKVFDKVAQIDETYDKQLKTLWQNNLDQYCQHLVQTYGDPHSANHSWIQPRKWNTIRNLGVDAPIGDMCIRMVMEMPDDFLTVRQGRLVLNAFKCTSLEDHDAQVPAAQAYVFQVKDPGSKVQWVREAVLRYFGVNVDVKLS